MEIIEGGITSPKGFKAAGIHCGIKKEKLDLAVIYSERPARCAMAYTQNRVRAAPIEVMMKKDPSLLQAIVVNSGNANAITGPRGLFDANQMISGLAKELRIKEDLVGIASTGVISRFLPMDKVMSGIPLAVGELAQSKEADLAAARAIMTTDTVEKQASCRVTLKDGTVATIAGITKGSGMISPSVKVLHATTLSFITTDAHLEKNVNRQWQEIMDQSFNVIDVDGDQSTNDISMLMANGLAGGAPADNDPAFWDGVRYVAQQLAKKIVIDGEGATKFIEVMVSGAKDPKAGALRRQGDHLFQPGQDRGVRGGPELRTHTVGVGQFRGGLQAGRAGAQAQRRRDDGDAVRERFTHDDTGHQVRGRCPEGALRQEGDRGPEPGGRFLVR